MGHPADHPLRIRPELLSLTRQSSFPSSANARPSAWTLPTPRGPTFSSSAWTSHREPASSTSPSTSPSTDATTHPSRPSKPTSASSISPILRLTQHRSQSQRRNQSLAEVFDFAKDYLGLLKAAVIASGIVPPGIEGSGKSLADLLAQIVGPGRGIEIISSVNDIPKGSRLAVSTNLLAALI